MTLPASGAITFDDLNTELGISTGTTIGLGDRSVSIMAGITPGNEVDIDDLYGKSNPWRYDTGNWWMQFAANMVRLLWDGHVIGTFSYDGSDKYETGGYTYYRGAIDGGGPYYYVARL